MALNTVNADIVVSNTATTIYTGVTSSQATILKASVLNTNTNVHYISVYRVVNGNIANTSNELIKDLPINPSQTIVLPLNGQVLVNGQSLQAICDANSVVNFNISLAVTT